MDAVETTVELGSSIAGISLAGSCACLFTVSRFMPGATSFAVFGGTLLVFSNGGNQTTMGGERFTDEIS
jgi:hypothetical protein